MRKQIENLLRASLNQLVDQSTLNAEAIPDTITIERTRDFSHGDFAANVAMAMARSARRNPRELAQQIVAALADEPQIEKVEIAGPGFINFYLTASARYQAIAQVLEHREQYGRSLAGAGRKVMVEFISANPTGPLHVGHGRLAAYGASVANLLEATGHEVWREYYVNDAGRQMDILAVSLWLRYLQACAVELPFPSNAYRGDYLLKIAATFKDEHGDALLTTGEAIFDGLPADGEGDARELHIDAVIARARQLLGDDRYKQIADAALKAVLTDIQQDLEQFGVHFDCWFSERSLVTDNLIQHALERLSAAGDLYQSEGATWFRASKYGDEKDRVVVRENGQTTYIASDIAYHLNKRERGHDLLLDLLGSDHHGYIARVRAGLVALDQPADSLEVQLVQFVTLYRNGQKAQMSTRSGQFVTLRELRNEVGNDAARLFYVMRSNDQHLNFDLDLARSRTEENPVYYIQYAHARVCSVLRTLKEQGLIWDQKNGLAHLEKLDADFETTLARELDRYEEVVSLAAMNRGPQMLVHYLRDLANCFHTYYNASRFIVDDADLRDARLCLIGATRQILVNGLSLLGVSAPESM